MRTRRCLLVEYEEVNMIECVMAWVWGLGGYVDGCVSALVNDIGGRLRIHDICGCECEGPRLVCVGGGCVAADIATGLNT